MKKEIFDVPEFMKGRELYGFDWLEHVIALPSPLALVTTYKSSGLTNGTMQSWFTSTSDNGYYFIFSSVNKGSHMYKTIKERKQLVINFPNAEVYKKCYSTIFHNREEDDELALAGLSFKKGSKVDAPIVEDCFINAECEYVWEKEICEGSYHVVMCVRVVNLWLDEEYFASSSKGRYGDTGYLYNIHSPLDPFSGKTDETYIAALKKLKAHEEL